MSIVSKIALVLALLGSTAALAFSVSPQMGGGIGQSDGGISVTGAAPGPPPLGTPLTLENGSTPLTMEDGTTNICLEGFSSC
jgi:hypothetical protein